jgi:MFS family permease
MPTILTQLGWLAADAQLHTIPIYGVGFVVTLFCAWWSDRIQHRYAFTIVGLAIACIGYIVLLCEGRVSVGARYTALFLVNVGNYITQPLAVVWLANNMGGHYKRSFGAALQIGLGNVGGIIGSNIFLQTEAPHYHTGYGTGLALLLLGFVLCTVFWYGLRWENKKRDRGERDYRLALAEVNNLGDDHPAFRYNA